MLTTKISTVKKNIALLSASQFIFDFTLLSTLNCVFDGAAIVIIKRIWEKSNLVKLNTFLVLLANASLLIGQYLGGYCFTKKGISEILIINAASFLLSGLINQFLYKEYCTAVIDFYIFMHDFSFQFRQYNICLHYKLSYFYSSGAYEFFA